MRYLEARATALLTAATSMALTGCGTAVSAGGQHMAADPAKVASATKTARCAIANLRLAGGREGENETAAGLIEFTNTGPRPCTLSGYPQVALIWHGHRLDVRAIRPPNLVLQAMVLAPGKPDAAQLAVDWGNWCGRRIRQLSVRVTIPGTGTAAVPFNGPPDYDYSPPCVQPGRPSQSRVIQAYAAA